MLLDDAGEISGAPIEVNLRTDDTPVTGAGAARHESMVYLRKFHAKDFFIAFDKMVTPFQEKRRKKEKP